MIVALVFILILLLISAIALDLDGWTLVFICIFGVWGYAMSQNNVYMKEMEKACAAKGGSLRTIVGAKGHYTGCVVPLN